MLRKLNKKTSGFTLIELLVVVLILAILMAVALPLYLNAVADSQLKTCRSNMQTIANAVQAKYVSAAGTTTYSTLAALPINTANFFDLTGTPVCPVYGISAYALIAPGTRGSPFGVQCNGKTGPGATTNNDHGEFDPEVDAN